MSTTDILSRRVITYRHELGLSQEAYAHECGLDRTYVSGVERGVKNPTVMVLEKLAKGLRKQPFELLVPFQQS